MLISVAPATGLQEEKEAVAFLPIKVAEAAKKKKNVLIDID